MSTQSFSGLRYREVFPVLQRVCATKNHDSSADGTVLTGVLAEISNKVQESTD